jgi:phosphomannomutase
MKWIFDVDGTLTPSRSKMDPEFQEYFLWFAKTHQVYLATGSDYPKTVEQVGSEICETVKACYNCSGNSIWVAGKEVYKADWELPELARYFLESCLYESKFSIRTGTHIEERPGMVNYSTIGRNCTQEERSQYVLFDTESNERHTIADSFNTMFPDLEAKVGGDTGIDIFPKGLDKSQIAQHIKGAAIFFGDKMMPGGNDRPLAEQIVKRFGGRAIEVKDWKDTWKRMKTI